MPYVGQDTNAAIELYHSYMKSILKEERSCMMGRQVDWCRHALIGDVLTHYRYSSLKKRHDFVENRKDHSITVSALILTPEILDSDVTLPAEEGAPAFVTFTNHRYV